MPEIKRVQPSQRMSQAVVCGPMVYLAGQVASDTNADAAGQTRQILDKIDQLLTSVGSSSGHMVSATVWLSDMSQFSAVNEVWDAWVPAGQAPTRACVEARLARPELLVEIAVVAALQR